MAIVKGVDTFATEAEADSYFAQDLRSESWLSLTTQKKEQGLVTAARQIDFLLKDSCKLGVINPAEVPVALSNANIELALLYIQNPTMISETNTAQRVKSVRGGKTNVQFFSTGVSSAFSTASRFPSIVMRWLQTSGCLSSLNLATVGGVASGTDAESRFENDNYNKTEGFF
jgi:hypothetical protein